MFNQSKIPWNVAKEIFQGEWIEIVDYEWGWASPYPRWVRVRHHAPDRKDLLSQIDQSSSDNSASSLEDPQDQCLILFVAPENSFIESHFCHSSEFHALDLKGSIV